MTFDYQGSELEPFATAATWKSYVATMIQPWLGSRVLEVGAGIGTNLQFLAINPDQQWFALEPDRTMTEIIRRKIADQKLPRSCYVIDGTLAHIAQQEFYDTILYIDVLEHIADDREELRHAVQHLRTGGHLVVLAPAHPLLYSRFDQAIGHYRRYSLEGLKQLTPPGCSIADCTMLDSVGFFASLANRLLLRSDQPSHRQIAFWDRCLVPMSRVADRLTGYRLGKTALIIWQRSKIG
jgi:SAM-dependent methyltransferase